MNKIDIILKSYSNTIFWPKWIKTFKGDSLWRHFLVAFTRVLYPFLVNPKHIDSSKSKGPRIIVSLTSFPARIDEVWRTIDSILAQTVIPDRIILWLSKEQFAGVESLPKKLQNRINKGLEIKFVDDDLKSHKKYIYAFQRYPNDYVVLVDDDIIYPSNTIETLLDSYDGTTVRCSYGCKMKWSQTGKILPYSEWENLSHNYIGKDLFFGSGGGTLLCPSLLPECTTNGSQALALCPSADDIWLNAMCQEAGVRIEKVRSGLIFPTKNSPKETLCSVNIGKGRNDEQIQNVINQFNKAFQNSAQA